LLSRLALQEFIGAGYLKPIAGCVCGSFWLRFEKPFDWALSYTP